MNRIVEVHVAAVFTGVKREEAKKAHEDALLDCMREIHHHAEGIRAVHSGEKISTSPGPLRSYRGTTMSLVMV